MGRYKLRVLFIIVVIAPISIRFASYAIGSKRQRPAQAPVTLKALVASEGVEHLDRLAREPMAVELRDGTLFVSGYDGNLEKSPNLLQSHDHGMTWEQVNVGSKKDGAIGNSDVDLAVDRDDTLYFVAMSYDNQKNEGTRIAIGASKDAGVTWTWKVLSESRFDDRPWVAAEPNGTAHVIWNDGNGVRHEVSQDRGTSWRELQRINGEGGSSHLAIGPRGEIAARIIPPSASGNKFASGVDLIAVSRDGGKTWRKHPAPGVRDWNPDDKGTSRWVEPVAWDADGALYSLWGSATGLWLARSSNQGKTWTNWHIVESDEDSYFPYLIARGHGELAATWYSGQDSTLQAHVARINVGKGKGGPVVIESQPFQTDAWRRQKDPGEPRHRDTAGEYIPVIFLRAGGLGVVTTIQNGPEKRLGFKWWKFEER